MQNHLAHPELPRGPNRSPLLNLYRCVDDPASFHQGSRTEFGDVFTLRLFGARPIVFFTTTEAAREIMREGGQRLGAANDIIQAILGTEGVFLKNGDAHGVHRKRLMPALTGASLFGHGPAMREVMHQGIDSLSPGLAVPVVPWARRVTLSVIQRCLFGMTDGEDTRALADEIIGLSEEGQRPSALMASLVTPPEWLERVTRGRFAPDGSREPDPPLIRALLRQPVASANRRVQDRLYDHVRAVRTGRIEAPPSSMLAQLIALAAQRGVDVPDREMVDDLITLLIAGHDTTAISFSWLVLLLGRHPDVLERVRAELRSEGGVASITAERMDKLPYLDAVVRESMRLTSITAGFVRRTLAPITLAGVDLPAGIDVGVLSMGPHLDADVFADAGRFDPSRMLDARVRPESWVPFGVGYRRCLGAFFAELELKLLIATFAERVSFEAVHQQGPVGRGTKGIITQPADDGLLRIHAVQPITRGVREAS